MSYKPTTVDRLLDEQGLQQMELDGALERVERFSRVVLTAIRLAAAADTPESRNDYLATGLEALVRIVRAKEDARIAAGNIAVEALKIRDLHPVIPTGRHAQEVAA